MFHIFHERVFFNTDVMCFNFLLLQIILSLRAETQRTFDAQQKIIAELQERARFVMTHDKKLLQRSRPF